MAHNAELGRRGEQLAVDHLVGRGMAVLERNWRCRLGEIDIVARDGAETVFIEVKTRAAGAFVSGYHAVDNRKKAVVLSAAKAYLRGLRDRPHTYRLDVVEVSIVSGGAPEVRHYENIELFPKHFRP